LQKIKKLKFDTDFSEIAIKGRSSGGNILTKNPIKKIELKSEGVSTLSARKIWFDTNVQRLNVEERGDLLGEFQAGDKLLTINGKGEMQLIGTELTTHFDEDMLVLEKWNAKKPISAIYFDGTKKSHYVKRFLVENIEGKFSFIGDHKDSVLEVLSTDWRPVAELVFVKQKGKDRKEEQLNIEEFITIKGWKALGNKLTNKKIKEIKLLNSLPYKEVQEEIREQEIEVIEDVSQEVAEIETEDSSDNKPNISDEGPHQITLDL
ncbi:MAG: DNA gyrase/topoisomerase IV subunit A, partial [Flavobacteriales bacterium]